MSNCSATISNNKKLTLIINLFTTKTMDPCNSPDVIFWDRLDSLKRTKKDGEVVERGSINGLNIIRIHQGQEGQRNFITSCFVMQSLLCANIKNWPSSVLKDGLTISLWLEDFSLNRNGYRCKFELTFFQQTSAELYFLFSQSPCIRRNHVLIAALTQIIGI